MILTKHFRWENPSMWGSLQKSYPKTHDLWESNLKPWSHGAIEIFSKNITSSSWLVMVSSCHNWTNLLSPFQNGVLIFSIWGFPKIVVPQNGWFIRETLLKWMIWGYHHLRNTHMFPGIHVRFGLLIFSPVFLWDLWDFPGRKIPAFLGSN